MNRNPNPLQFAKSNRVEEFSTYVEERIHFVERMKVIAKRTAAQFWYLDEVKSRFYGVAEQLAMFKNSRFLYKSLTADQMRQVDAMCYFAMRELLRIEHVLEAHAGKRRKFFPVVDGNLFPRKPPVSFRFRELLRPFVRTGNGVI